jgi:transposase, IS6 family
MLQITASNLFKWRHYQDDIILWCVRWYLRYPISFAQIAEMAAERGLATTASCIWRWVQVYGPEIDKRCRPHLKRTNRSWRLDETYINVKGRDRFLYRAVDSTGQTIDFLLTDRRDAAAAKRFFRRALQNNNAMPRVINVDKNPAYPRAVTELKADGTINRRCRLRQCKYLNNIVEQDHRNVKRRTWLAKGHGSLPTAWRTLRGIEAMEMMRKGRAKWVAKGNVVGQVNFISSLFGIVA